MNVIISKTKEILGEKAAEKGTEMIQKAILKNGKANIIVATGASQFEMLKELVKSKIDWSKVTVFHLDEYIGIDENHPASFRKYLKERFADKVPLKTIYYVNGNGDPVKECARLNDIIRKHPIDVAFVGIGENSHLAFNDPPADLETEEPYIIVKLDEACRNQQLGEGWFPTFDDVPKEAISMSIKHILKSEVIIASIPDERKAEAVKKSLKGDIGPDIPSSVLQNHKDCFIFLDEGSAKLIK